MNKDQASRLRRDLHNKLSELQRLLQPVFEPDPVLPGVVTTSRHRCGNSGCSCTREGTLHEAVRVMIRFKDGYATRSLSEDTVDSFRARTEAYRRLRKAKVQLRTWQKDLLRLVDEIERARRSLDGLSEEDRQRPLR